MKDKTEADPIGEYLESCKVGYRTHSGGIYDHEVHSFGFAGKNISNIECAIHFTEGGRIFTVFAMVNNIVPKEKMVEVLRLINQANHLSRFSTMILDTEEGNFWSRQGNVSANDVDPVIYDSAIKNVCGMMDDYYPLIMKLIYADKTAKEVLIEWFEEGNENSAKPTVTDISGYQ